MRKRTDLLVGGIVASSLMVLTMTPRGGASFQFSSQNMPAFSESFLLTVEQGPVDPPPSAFQAMDKLGRIVITQYEVQPNDTLSSLAKSYGSTADYLRSTNHLESVRLSPRQSILIHNGRGMLYQVREKKGKTESLADIAGRYGKSSVAIAQANHLPGVALLSNNWVRDGSVLFLPNTSLRFTDYILPVAWMRGRNISSGFGMRFHPILRTRRLHTGWDLPRPYGSQVVASRAGTVISTGWSGAYGKLIIIRHPGPFFTWYGHLSQINVQPGEKVRKGQFIGRVGSTGLSTGPHLHFEVRDQFGKSLNPRQLL